MCMYVVMGVHIYPCTIGHLASMQHALPGLGVPAELLEASATILGQLPYGGAAAAIGNGFHVGCAARALLQGVALRSTRDGSEGARERLIGPKTVRCGETDAAEPS
jgi:hypothetical protein